MYISCSFLIKISYIIYIIIEAKKSIKNIKLANRVIILIILLDETKLHIIPKIKYIIATNKYITIFNSSIFYSFQFTIDFSITLYIVYHIECIFRVVFK